MTDDPQASGPMVAPPPLPATPPGAIEVVRLFTLNGLVVDIALNVPFASFAVQAIAQGYVLTDEGIFPWHGVAAIQRAGAKTQQIAKMMPAGNA